MGLNRWGEERGFDPVADVERAIQGSKRLPHVDGADAREALIKLAHRARERQAERSAAVVQPTAKLKRSATVYVGTVIDRLLARGVEPEVVAFALRCSVEEVQAASREGLETSGSAVVLREEERQARDARVRLRRHKGDTLSEIAADEGLSVSTVSRICQREGR